MGIAISHYKDRYETTSLISWQGSLNQPYLGDLHTHAYAPHPTPLPIFEPQVTTYTKGAVAGAPYAFGMFFGRGSCRPVEGGDPHDQRGKPIKGMAKNA